MAYDLTQPLVIGISSRALFDLEEENRIFEERGLNEYVHYQMENEREILKKGKARAIVGCPHRVCMMLFLPPSFSH